MSDTFLRQWSMLRAIPRFPRKIDAATLVSRLESDQYIVDIRTVQRDLKKLSKIFPLMCDEQSVPFGWSWAKDAIPLDVPGMDANTALTFQLAKQELSQQLPPSTLHSLQPYFENATHVLNEIAKPGLGDWPNKIRVIPRTQRLIAPKMKHEVLDEIYNGLLKDRKITASYDKRTNTTLTEYVLNPLAIIYRDQIGYLIATHEKSDGLRQFALHRFREAKMTNEPCTKPEGFNLDEFIKEGQMDIRVSNKPIKLKVLFEAKTAFHLNETPLSEDQEMLPQADGRVLITATVPDTEQLRWWLNGFGEKVEVVSPEGF